MPTSHEIANPKEAVKEVLDAGYSARFVPVLGFELSCLEEYNTTPKELATILGPESPQVRQLELLRERARRCAAALPPSEDGLNDIPFLARQYLKDLNFFDDSANESPVARPAARGAPELTLEPPFIHLVANVACLVTKLTVVWADHLACKPVPIGPSFAPTLAELSEVDGDAYGYMHRCLNCCASMWARLEKKKLRDANALRLAEIYTKLLFFASEVFPEKRFWSVPNPCAAAGRCCDDKGMADVRACHRDFIATHTSCNWTQSFGVNSRRYETGVRRSHLLWLQGLLRHLLLAGTRAFRTRDELAFLLLLDDEIERIPDAATDPFETSLLRVQDYRDLETLREVLSHCEGGGGSAKSGARRACGSGSVQAPQPFYRALAIFLRQARELADRSAEAERRQRARRQVVLSMCLDREMERAVAQEFEKFRIALPVTRGDRWKTDWLIGHCVRKAGLVPVGYVVEKWIPADKDPNQTLDCDGPLIVKLFGSPLEDLSHSASEDAGMDIPQHRLVLDETDLLSSLVDHLPEMYAHLDTHLTANQLFFFGHGAMFWSQRVPYVLLRSVAYKGASQGHSAAVSLGDAGTLGAPALQRLSISHLGSEVRSNKIITNFMAEVAAKESSLKGRRP